MRKTLTLTTAIAAVLLAGCAQHGVAPHSLRTAAHAPVQKTKAARRPPLALELDGVRFDQITRVQAVKDLEARGFTPKRVSPHFACDIFTPPRSMAGASRLGACWMHGKWAESFLIFPQLPPAGARPRPPWHTLLLAFTHKFGDRARFSLPHTGPRYVRWSVDGGRGAVKLTRSFPGDREVLSIADLRATRALVQSVRQQQRERDKSEDPLAAQPARSAPAQFTTGGD